MRLSFSHPWLILALASLITCVAQPTPAPGAGPPIPPSPVSFFRELLELNEAERGQLLASRPATQRSVIEAKLREYEALPPTERDMRLRATELRWYLRPLLEVDPQQRAGRVAQVPGPLRSVVEQRLAAWDRLTPHAQREFLESDGLLQYFLRLESASPAEQQVLKQRVDSERRPDLERQFDRWQALPPHQRQRAAERFQRFFELPSAEQEKTLEILPESERAQIEATLQTFARLPAAQRQATLEAFHRFSDLSAAERSQFLRNADRWKEMSPADRATWRRLVPQLPPMPPGMYGPPLPPSAPRPARGPNQPAG
jgi:hypothetical protein